jgi:outer membrane lipoprotein-sorting protein
MHKQSTPKAKVLAFTAVAAFAGFTTLPVLGQTAEVKTAEQVYKNIAELKGMPADQLDPTMRFISASLGVQCTFCHVRDKDELDDKKPKKDARKMIAMTLAINKGHFEGNLQVTCFTCHQGSARVNGMPPVVETDAAPAPREEMQGPGGGGRGPQGPTAEQILEKYVTALGGADAIKKVTTRVEKGKIIARGNESDIELLLKAPNKRISINKTQNGESITAFDGKIGWLGATGRPAREMGTAETDAAGLDAELYFPLRIKEIFRQLRPGRPEKIGDVECVSLNGIRPNLPPVRLYFDAKTGLLVRMVRFANTPVGRNPTQIDYADYRDVDGVKMPFRWTLARPNGRFTIQVSEVKQNVPVEDSRFNKPAGN